MTADSFALDHPTNVAEKAKRFERAMAGRRKEVPDLLCECGGRRMYDAERDEESCIECGLVLERSFVSPEPGLITSERVRHHNEPAEPVIFAPKTFIQWAQAALALSEQDIQEACAREKLIPQRVQNTKHRAAIATHQSGKFSLRRTALVFEMDRLVL